MENKILPESLIKLSVNFAQLLNISGIKVSRDSEMSKYCSRFFGLNNYVQSRRVFLFNGIPPLHANWTFQELTKINTGEGESSPEFAALSGRPGCLSLLCYLPDYN